MRLHLNRLEALDEPPTLVALRELVARMLPRVDLPEVLLEVTPADLIATRAETVTTRRAAAGAEVADLAATIRPKRARITPQQ